MTFLAGGFPISRVKALGQHKTWMLPPWSWTWRPAPLLTAPRDPGLALSWPPLPGLLCCPPDCTMPDSLCLPHFRLPPSLWPWSLAFFLQLPGCLLEGRLPGPPLTTPQNRDPPSAPRTPRESVGQPSGPFVPWSFPTWVISMWSGGSFTENMSAMQTSTHLLAAGQESEA